MTGGAWIGYGVGLLGSFVVGVACGELLRDDPGLPPRRRLAVVGVVAIVLSLAGLVR